jgi:anti-sigma factor RsiW
MTSPAANRFDDESLMRYADGTAAPAELSAIEAALSGDAGLRARVAMFRQMASLAHAAMNEVLHEPVPQRLVDAVRSAPAAKQARIGDETLMAYADGALDAAEAARVAGIAARDRDVERRISTFRQTAVLARAAYAPVLDEAVPQRLIDAVRTTPAAASAGNVVAFKKKSAAASPVRAWAGWAVAASLLVFVGLGASGQFAGRLDPVLGGLQLASSDRWLENVAGFYAVAEATQTSEGRLLVDFTAADVPELGKWFGAKLNRNLAIPDLTVHGFALQGGRMVIVGGKPAAQLIYTNTANEMVGLVIAFSQTGERSARSEARQNVNLVHWHRGGYGYAFAGRIGADRLKALADQAWNDLEAI